MASFSSTGSEMRGGKRPLEESITDKFFREVCIEAREHFENETESSVQKKTGTKHIIYYQPFVNFDLVIKNIPTGIPTSLLNDVPDTTQPMATTDALQNPQSHFFFEIRINPVDWARAFNQLDFLPTVKFLYVAMLTEHCRSVIDVDPTAKGNIHDLIRRWMMAKFGEDSHIDPWAFPLEYSKIMEIIPEPDESTGAMEIDKIMAHLNPDECVRPVVQQILKTPINRATDYWNSNSSTAARAKLEKKKQEDKKFDDWFRQCVEYVPKNSEVPMNAAQIVAAATRSTLSSNNDQIVDGVQFSVENERGVTARWGEAFKEGQGLDYPGKIGKIAARLCSPILRLDFEKTWMVLAQWRIFILQSYLPFIVGLNSCTKEDSKLTEIKRYSTQQPNPTTCSQRRKNVA